MNHIHSTNILYKKQITQLKKKKKKKANKKVWRESSSLLWSCLIVFFFSVCEDFACMSVCRLFYTSKKHEWVLNICSNLRVPTAEINMT